MASRFEFFEIGNILYIMAMLENVYVQCNDGYLSSEIASGMYFHWMVEFSPVNYFQGTCIFIDC